MNQPLRLLHQNARRLPTPPSPAAYFEGCRRRHACSPDDVLLFSRIDSHELRRRSAESHLHRRFCLVNCLETAGTVSVDGVPFALEPGNAHLVFPQSYHQFLNLKDSRILWLMVTFETTEPERLAPLRQLTLKLNAEDHRDLGRMVSCFSDTTDGNRGDTLSLILSQLLCRLCDRAGDRAPADIPGRAFAGIWQRLQKELESLPPEDLRIAPLAKRLHISDRHLRERFKAQFGVQLGTYLRNYRIRRAIGLLASTRLTFAEISDRCGYRSASSFHRAFIRHTGMRPAEFRK